MRELNENQLLEFLREQIAQRTDASAESIHADSLLVDLGLQSIDAVLVCGEIEEEFDVEVDPEDIFEHDTLGAFVRSVIGEV